MSDLIFIYIYYFFASYSNFLATYIYIFFFYIGHQSIFRQKKALDENIVIAKEFEEFCTALDEKKLILSPYCGEISCEDNIKKLSAR